MDQKVDEKVEIQARRAHAGHISLGQLQVMSAIQRCRTDQLGGHVLHCVQCDDQLISYNSCRNRHCPKCCGSKAQQWLEDRKSELLPVEYFHVVFTLPAQIADIAYQNKAVVYALLFKASAQALSLIAADPKHLGARIGFTSVLHTWGSALTHHPHVHCVVPGGGLVKDRWQPCKQGFFLPVRVLSRLFRRLFCEQLLNAYQDDKLKFFGHLGHLQHRDHFNQYLAPLRGIERVVYVKRPFGIARLVSLSKTHSISAVLGAHIEMTIEAGEHYSIGTIYQPNEAPLTLTPVNLASLNLALEQSDNAQEIALDEFIVVSMNAFQKAISNIARWIVQ